MNEKTPLHAYIGRHGSITRDNPALVKLAKQSGYSVEHLFRIALGRRASRPCAMVIAKAVKDPLVTMESLRPEHVPPQAPARSDTRKPANGSGKRLAAG